MATLTSPIVVGTASTSTNHAADLGKIVFADGKIYKVCKATSTIALAASKGLVTAFSAGVPTWNVDAAAAGGSVDNDIVFVPAGQVGSTGTTSLIAGDYFLAQVGGPATFLCANTTMVKAVGQGLQVSSLGLVSALSVVTVASLVVFRGQNCQVTNTAGAAATGSAITGVISGLV